MIPSSKEHETVEKSFKEEEKNEILESIDEEFQNDDHFEKKRIFKCFVSC